MIIGFDAKRAFFNRSGLGNYSRNLLNSFFSYYPENGYILYSPAAKGRIEFAEPHNYTLSTPEKALHRAFPSLWRSRGISRQIKSDSPDIFHGLSSELPRSLPLNVKKVVTVHDLIYMRYPQMYSPANRNIYYLKTRHACASADQIIAISEQTKTDIMNFTGTDAGKITVIYQDCHPSFRVKAEVETKKALRKKYSLPDNYLLYVGTIEERKNLLSVVSALHTGNIDIPLVVIGRKTAYYRKVKAYINNNNMRNIIFPAGVENKELPALYQMASCFIYPSVFEGFGIPLVEALVSGVPVITSRGSCFSEAGGPGSIYIDPHDIPEISDAILSVINDTRKAAGMVSDGLKHATGFRSDKIAAQYMEIYRSIF
ncbi:MAG: glycosyltransferase family 1 protein [Bacteroidales bacterium]|nr:glycosyltransferase family 1 protein [Bacteroidales bacterium]